MLNKIVACEVKPAGTEDNETGDKSYVFVRRSLLPGLKLTQTHLLEFLLGWFCNYLRVFLLVMLVMLVRLVMLLKLVSLVKLVMLVKLVRLGKQFMS